MSKEVESLLEKGRGFKITQGKVEYSQIPPEILKEVAWVLTEGAVDHGSDDNWKKVPHPKKAYYNAGMRHIEEWRGGEKYNTADHGRHHLAYAIANFILLMWHDEYGDQNERI